MLPSASSEDHKALNPVEFLELSVLKTIVMKLLLLKIGAISVMVPHNLLITLSSESKTEKRKKNQLLQYYSLGRVEISSPLKFSHFLIHFVYESLLYHLQCSHRCRKRDILDQIVQNIEKLWIHPQQ